MITQIGLIEGKILGIMDKKPFVTVENLVNDLAESRDMIIMAIGALIREGLIKAEKTEEDMYIWPVNPKLIAH